MSHVHFTQGLQPELLEALRTMTEGGVLSAVAQAEQNAGVFMPCWIMRTPASREQVHYATLRMTTRLVIYDEGPLVIFHFTLYDQPPQIKEVRLSYQHHAIHITPATPFHLECFLNPTEPGDRMMIQTLAESQVLNVEYYRTDTDMTYQATKQHPNDVSQRHAARDILKATQGMTCSIEHFLAARNHFLLENPLF
ncbi:MAG: hypothetical protein ABI324_24160 [Ktedonobacteraceae bacterium]